MKEVAPQNSTRPIFFGMARRKLTADNRWTIEIVWSRVGLLALLGMAAAYLALSFVVYCIFKYVRNYDEMSFADAVTAIVNRKALTEKFGDYNIRQSKKFMSEGKFREAYMSLVSGTSRSPKNLEGRLILAEFYSALFKRPDRAIETLERSLSYALDNVQYVRMYMKLLMDQTEDARAVKVGEKILASGTKNKEVELYIAMCMSTIYAYHGNYKKSHEYIYKYGLEKSLPGILRLSKNEWELGNRDAAIKVLADNISFPQNREAIYELLVNYYVAMKDFSTARQYSMLRSLENPFSTEQRMEYLTLLKHSGDEDGVRRDMELFYNNYQDDNKSMLYLANFAADVGDLPFMRRIYDLAIRKNFPIAPYCLLLLETTIAQGDYKAAVYFVEDIMKTKPRWREQHDDVILCLRAVAYYAVGNNNMSDILINDIIKRNTIPSKVMVATARMYDRLGATAVSLRILERAAELYPRHQLVLTRLIQSELKIGMSGNLHKHVAKLLQMRRPPRELIADARVNLCSDRFIFASDRDEIIKEIDDLMTSNEGAVFSSGNDVVDKERITDGGGLNF